MTNLVEELRAKIPEIEERLQYTFQKKDLLVLAFVHRSFYNENRDIVSHHNERLEFLGDSILGLLVSDYLYTQLPNEPEGHLSNFRSHIVEASSCVSMLNALGVAPFVLLGKGERLNDGRGRETILADLLEALIGAIYLDGGLEAVRRFLFTHFEEKIQQNLKAPFYNWKAELQDYSQKKYQKPPFYKVISETGPDHSKVFEVAACIDDVPVGQGAGASKKEAEQAAAEDALRKLGVVKDE